MILILSNKWDLTVDFVVQRLRQMRHPFLRLNTEDLVNEKATITLPDFHIFVSKQNKLFDLTRDVRVIWNRRPGRPFDDIAREEKPSQATQKFIFDQWYSWLEALQLIPDATWINHPHCNDAMESKIRQLKLASQLGFRIPTTLITNDPSVAQTQLKRFSGKLIAKALYSPLIEEPSQDFFIFTNEIKEISSSEEDEITLSPSIFQEPILPKIDYRVTVIGDVVISAKIESENTLPISLDWRKQKDGVRFTRCELPQYIESLCRTYVKENGLIFGAIDLLEHKDSFVFLEINPNGEWGWLQKPYGFPIAETLCDLMVKYDS